MQSGSAVRAVSVTRREGNIGRHLVVLINSSIISGSSIGRKRQPKRSIHFSCLISNHYIGRDGSISNFNHASLRDRLIGPMCGTFAH